MNQNKCGTIAGPNQYRPTTVWRVVYPDGSDSGTEHMRYLDASSELLSIDRVRNEVMDRLRSAREMDWNREDDQMWVRENTPDIAKELGYRLDKVIR